MFAASSNANSNPYGENRKQQKRAKLNVQIKGLLKRKNLRRLRCSSLRPPR
jgi:hypothetical protein